MPSFFFVGLNRWMILYILMNQRVLLTQIVWERTTISHKVTLFIFRFGIWVDDDDAVVYWWWRTMKNNEERWSYNSVSIYQNFKILIDRVFR